MPWSWFISLEVQFFIVSSLLMLLSKNHPKYAMTLCSSFFISSIITSTLMKFDNGITGNSTVNHLMENQLSNYNMVIDQPWIRIGPYLIGMCFGYFLHLKKSMIKVPKFLCLLCKLN